MPYFIVTLIVYLCNMALFANNPTQQLTTTIDQVTVYLNGANVHQSTTTQLLSGKTEVVLVGLSSELRSENSTIAVEGAKLISTIFNPIDWKRWASSRQRHSLDNFDYPPNIKSAKDSIARFQDDIVDKQHEKDALVSEKEMILQNKTVGGSQNGLSVAELQKAADFYRTRLKDIADRITAIDRQIDQIQTSIKKIDTRIEPLLQTINNESYKPSIILLLESDATKTVRISVTYTTQHAEWRPNYVIRTIDIDQPVQLNYQAQIYNNSGFDWNNVQLKLMVGSIQSDATIPTLEAWLLNYDTKTTNTNDINQDIMANYQRPSTPQEQYAYDHDINPDIRRNQPTTANNDENTTISNLNAEFILPSKHSITTNKNPYLVDIIQHQLNTTYTHLCVPKLDSRVYLIARVVGWEDLNLVEGDATLYEGDSYVGTAKIDLNTLRDTLLLSLGTDSKVQCTKLKIKDKSNKKLLNLMYRESFAYTIATKNNRNKPINIEIWDQVPVSQEKDITVDIEEISGAQLDAPSGKLVWRLDVAPAKTESLSV
ncbi:MAG TPA: mucoidy inhibitor MuiA family protein, partial [Chitinophagales bacterium]|nr:mucoidy inhibitor MuiA family protein [Chitinophagales bacterium]